jgi:hypothetical protein
MICICMTKNIPASQVTYLIIIIVKVHPRELNQIYIKAMNNIINITLSLKVKLLQLLNKINIIKQDQI